MRNFFSVCGTSTLPIRACQHRENHQNQDSWFWWFSLCWQARIGRVEVSHTEKKLRIVKNYIIPSKCATFFEGPTPLTISSKAPQTRKMLGKINGLSKKWGEPPEWWMENPQKISRQKLQAFCYGKSFGFATIVRLSSELACTKTPRQIAGGPPSPSIFALGNLDRGWNPDSLVNLLSVQVWVQLITIKK